MSQFRISDQAKTDLREVWRYIARRNEPAADRLVDQIIEHYETLAKFPGMGRSREELAPGLRSFPVGKYVVFYRPIDDGIEVVRVLHGAQDISALFEE
jgi:toxin ParE1/3/4